MPLHEPRRRSVGFLDREGESWACFLVTFPDGGGRWHGYFSFRPRDGELEEDEVRTADIFLEDSEAEIDRKARGLGRPLLSGLLASSLHTREREAGGASPRLRRWFRQILAENSRELAGGSRNRQEGGGRSSGGNERAGGADGAEPGPDAPTGSDMGSDAEPELAELRSLYASYRLDQVAHFIALLRPEDFQDAVDRILDGTSFDFGARDRLQFAMMVVEYIEERLPLPPFEVWVEDYVQHREAYALYAHTLHREGRLP